MTLKQFSRSFSAAVAKFKSSLTEGEKPARHMAAQKTILCRHCGLDQFVKSRLASTTFVYRVSAAGHRTGIHALVCANCSYVALFAAEPQAHDVPVQLGGLKP